MKISQKTIDILKNFSTINQGIVVSENTNELRTISVGENIIAFAEIPEDFTDFAIYDLNQFLNTISLFKDPDFDFEDKQVTIKNENGGGSCKYVYTESSLVTTFDKSISMPNSEVTFSLTQNDLSKLLKAASVMSLPDIIVSNNDDNKKIILSVTDKEDTSSNTFDIEVGDYSGTAKFSFHYKTEHFKMLPYDYEVSISNKYISEFKNDDEGLTYYVAVAKSSTFE